MFRSILYKNKWPLIVILFLPLSALIVFFLINANKSKQHSTIYLHGIKLGGEWFLANRDETFLHYEYDMAEQTHSPESHALRELAALWAVGHLAHFLDESRYADLAQRGMSYFEKDFTYVEDEDFMYVSVTPGKFKLGYNAFAILALLEVDHPQRHYYLEKLANGILYQQNSDGSFDTFFFSDRETGIDYYPGESMLALMALHEEVPDQRYLDSIEKAFPYYREYWRDNKNTAFIAWQTRALTKYYKHSGNEDVAEFVFEINDYLLHRYQIGEGCSFVYDRGIETAVHVEGVNQAYSLAKILHHEDRAECYRTFIMEGLDYILSLQMTHADTDDKFAVGGFLRDPDAETLRVDRNQHAVFALMDAYDVGVLER